MSIQSDRDILTECRKRFRSCQEYESYARDNFRSDLRFGYGDSRNLFQWENAQTDARNSAGKPVFTVNRVKVYCQQIINDARQHKAMIEIRPVGGGASYDSATIMEGIVRHIEAISTAQTAYDQAVHDMVFGGIGYFRLCTEYRDSDSFAQEIKIKCIPNALSVYLDKNIQTKTGEDAMYGYIFSDMDRKEFERDHPNKTGYGSSMPLDSADLDNEFWQSEDRIRVVEYYRKVMDRDVLHLLEDGTMIRRSEVDPKKLKKLDNVTMQTRDVETPKIEWYLIAGGETIVERNVFPGKYIPIIRVPGPEIVIDGQLDRLSHVRSLTDPQKAYNWYTSSGIEFVANQSKSPWVASVESIEGQEEYWRNNTANYSVLPYNGLQDDGSPMEPPRRADPPVYAAAFLDGMKVSAGEMELVSAQPPASMGEDSNERSGRGVEARQRQAANSTYHFVDSFATALRYTGKVLLQLIPLVYDTPQVMKILSQDGAQHTVQIDQSAPQAHQEVQGLDDESYDPQQIAAIFNPNIGDYDCVAEVGPQFSSRRQEFVSATLDILAQNESLAPLILDLVFQNMDFPGAQTIAKRARRMVPPQALSTGNDPHITQLQTQLAAQHQLLGAQQQELVAAKAKADATDLQKSIDLFEAFTSRIKVLADVDPEAVKPLVRELMSQAVGGSINDIIHAHRLEDMMSQAVVSQSKQRVQADQKAQQAQQAVQQSAQPPGGAPPTPPQPPPQGAMQ